MTTCKKLKQCAACFEYVIESSLLGEKFCVCCFLQRKKQLTAYERKMAKSEIEILNKEIEIIKAQLAEFAKKKNVWRDLVNHYRQELNKRENIKAALQSKIGEQIKITGSNFKHLRTRLRLTQQQAADKLKISVSQLKGIEAQRLYLTQDETRLYAELDTVPR